MSYILDALKKAEQERQQGSVPTLQHAVLASTAARKPPYMAYALGAITLTGAGLVAGILQPWRSDTIPAPVPVTTVAVPPPTVAVTAPRPVSAQPVAPINTAPVVVPVAKAVTVAPPAAPEPVAHAAGDDILPTLDMLPADLRQGIPPLNVLMHAYSASPKDRLVMVNNKPLHEGDRLTTDLALERIVPDGMVFNYRGTRFKTGVK
jgi:general secretion pathway protein B